MPAWISVILEFWTSDGHRWFTEVILRPLASYLAIPVALASFATWYTVTVGRGLRLRRAAKKALLSAGGQPAAILTVNLTAPEIDAQIESYLKRRPLPEPVSPEFVFTLRHAGDIGASQIANLVRELRDRINTMSKCGVRHVHLFYAGPVAFAAIIGCELKHSFTVTLYQNSRTSQDYECWGVLRLPSA